MIGFRIRRHGYLVRAAIDERTASRDFTAWTEIGLLATRGATRGRHYVAGPKLLELRSVVRRKYRGGFLILSPSCGPSCARFEWASYGVLTWGDVAEMRGR